MDRITLISYEDDRYDYCKIVDGEQEFFFSRTGNGGLMKDIILTDREWKEAGGLQT